MQPLPSLHRALGLSVVVKPSLFAPDAPQRYERLTAELQTLSFQWLADGGCWVATIGLNDSLVNVERWLEQGLALHVEINGPSLDCEWDGFINQVDVNTGALSETAGPLIETVNRDSVVYAPILDTSVNPPVIGSQISTIIAQDADSQGRWGTFEQVYPGGTALATRAEQQRDLALTEKSEPPSGQELTIGSGSPPACTLTCAGYGQLFNTYVFQDLNADTIAVSDKINAVIDNDPNDVFSAARWFIEDNAFLVERYENTNRFAWTVLQELFALGDDATDRRTTFAILPGQVPRYETIPTEPTYEFRVTGRSQRVRLFGGGSEVFPWAVRPGRWIFFPDFLVGRNRPAQNMAQDRRFMFVESAQYTAPWGISLTGSQDAGRLRQLIAKRGYWS